MKNRPDYSPAIFAFAHHCELHAAGDEAIRNGNISEARKFFQVALEYHPEDSDTWRALANCYAAMNKLRKAEECFRRALHFVDAESIADINFDLGNCLYDQEKYAEAVQFYLQIPPGSTVWREAARSILLAKKMLSHEKASS